MYEIPVDLPPDLLNIVAGYLRGYSDLYLRQVKVGLHHWPLLNDWIYLTIDTLVPCPTKKFQLLCDFFEVHLRVLESVRLDLLDYQLVGLLCLKLIDPELFNGNCLKMAPSEFIGYLAGRETGAVIDLDLLPSLGIRRPDHFLIRQFLDTSSITSFTETFSKSSFLAMRNILDLAMGNDWDYEDITVVWCLSHSILYRTKMPLDFLLKHYRSIVYTYPTFPICMFRGIALATSSRLNITSVSGIRGLEGDRPRGIPIRLWQKLQKCRNIQHCSQC